MLPGKYIKRYDRAGLRRNLLFYFGLLAIPTAFIIWQAYGQLKWESFYQYRQVAEELTSRIDTELQANVRAANDRSVADYAFLVVGGPSDNNFVAPSPLSAVPPVGDIPGTIGYFQVDAGGAFSTPLLPPPSADPAQFGLSSEDMQYRQELASDLQRLLATNRLLESEVPASAEVATAEPPVAPRKRQQAMDELEEESAGRADSPVAAAKVAAMQESKATVLYDQAKFEALQKLDSTSSNKPAASAPAESAVDYDDLSLDRRLESRAYDLEADRASADRSVKGVSREAQLGQSLQRRKEKTTLPATEVAPTQQESLVWSYSDSELITTFESEVEPMQLRMLDDGHLVAFRNVWREGERIIQGILIDTAIFFQSAVVARYRESSLSQMAAMAIGYQGAIRLSVSPNTGRMYSSRPAELRGSLLYRSRLAEPAGGLELFFTIDSLPPGPGARVLAGASIAIALVFILGFVGLYRLGLGQINLARQQQDFVSAISHELKTPLTSIRMYGEMLKEGWASEDKRQQYYEYIHDESERLARLIANVLQLSRITRNDLQLELATKPVSQLLKDAEAKIRSHVERTGFTLEIVDETADARIKVDEDSFMQILINLVDNAIKFSASAERKLVRIQARSDSRGQVAITVRDFGPGIPKDQLRKIFRLFYRPKSELTRESVGTGIGLSIVQQLMSAMNGRVDAANARPGARLTLSFPAV